ncbi:hypothetical protein [Nocardioides sp. CFH 31398]|uniref:hypothetical protein n=1 Tax=Nocardioides sp. CFH 31398 TaxID=2919579 RepID=UPI001F05A208|nr:hypothetical protein [Nocardioides sp. CFH 31398]MCH1867074.1 hypothetical protein [Nocardioides sp. CFH 31398]
MSRNLKVQALAEFDALEYRDQVSVAMHQAKGLKPERCRESLQAGALNPHVVLQNIARARRLAELEAEIGRVERSFDCARRGRTRRTVLKLVDGGAA